MPKPHLLLCWGLLMYLIPNAMLGADIAAIKQELAQAKHDTARANLMVELGAAYWYIDGDSALYWGEQALAFADKIGFVNAKARAYNVIAAAYDNRSNYVESEKYYKLSLVIYEKSKDYKKLLVVLNNLGTSYYAQSRYDESLELYNKIVKIASERNIKNEIAIAYNNMGLVYEVKGNLIKALDLYMLAAKLAERAQDYANSSFSYMNAGYTYARIGHIHKAIELYNKSIEYSQKINEEYNIASVKMYMAELEIESRPDSAGQLPLLRDALAMFMRAKDNITTATCFDDMGQVYRFAKDTARAQQHFDKALHYANMVQNDDAVSMILYHVAGMNFDHGQAKRAIRIAEEARKIAHRSGLLPNEAKILKLLLKIYEHEQDIKNYIFMSKNIQILSDSLSKIDNSKIFESIQENYDNYKTIIENDELKRKEAEQLATIKQQQNQRVSLLIGLIIIAAIAIILFLNYRNKANANKILKTQKQELKDLNAVKDKILSIIAHDLRGPLNSIEGLMTVLEAGMLSADEQQMLVQRIRFTNATTLETLDTLLRWARAQKGSEAMDRQPVDMYRMVEKKSDFFAEDLRRKNQTLENRVQPGTIVLADETQLDFVIRNLVANAIKFTPAQGLIVVETRAGSGKTLQVVVRDTGVGMTEMQQKGLFHPATHTSTQGTAGEKGSGLGLLLSKEFIENNSGKIDVHSEPGNGTEFIVTLQRA